MLLTLRDSCISPISCHRYPLRVSFKDTEHKPVRVGLISLGCAKNLVDAEIMLGSLVKGGVEITNDAASADVVIVNTCSFIDAAQEESVDAILESDEVRQAQNRGQGLDRKSVGREKGERQEDDV